MSTRAKLKRSAKSSRKKKKTESALRSYLDFPKIEIARDLGRDDIEFFARYFLAEYISTEPCQFHRDLYTGYRDAIESNKRHRKAIAAPRENAKSTITAEVLPLWCICYKKKNFIVVAADATPQAKRHIAAIKEELEDNPLLLAAFPGATGEGPKWTEEEIRTRNKVTVIATGTGKRIRGVKQGAVRPDLLIGDDLENDENVITPEQRDKSENWFFKAFAKAGKDADVFVVGTVLHYDSLLSRLLNNPTFAGRKYRSVIRWSDATVLWDEWEQVYTDWTIPQDKREAAADEFYKRHHAAMDAGTEVLWPEWESYYELMKQRVAEGPASFDSEKQNEPINPDDCLFQEEWFQWFDEDDLPGSMPIVTAVDPSLGKSGKHGDPSAIVSIGRGANGVLYVLDADIQRRPPDKIIEDCIELHQRRGLSALGVEAVQFQDFFKDILIKEASLRGQYPPTHAIQQTRDKVMRIQRLQPLVKSGRLRFQKKHKKLFEQLKYFPKADHDDGPDALEMAVQMIEKIGQSYGSVKGKRTQRQGGENLKRVFG